MDHNTFLLLAPHGTRILTWAEPTDDEEAYTILTANGEYVTGWSPAPLLLAAREAVRPLRRTSTPRLRLAA